jgi:hypothetical protein
MVIMIDCAQVSWQANCNAAVNTYGNLISKSNHMNLSGINAGFEV